MSDEKSQKVNIGFAGGPVLSARVTSSNLNTTARRARRRRLARAARPKTERSTSICPRSSTCWSTPTPTGSASAADRRPATRMPPACAGPTASAPRRSGCAAPRSPRFSSSTSSPGTSQRPSPCSSMQPPPTVPDPITSPSQQPRRVARRGRQQLLPSLVHRPGPGFGPDLAVDPRHRPQIQIGRQLIGRHQLPPQRGREVLALGRPEPDRASPRTAGHAPRSRS